MLFDWRRLSLARTEHELAAQILSDWSTSLGAGLAGVYLWKNGTGGEVHTRRVADALLEDYEAFGRIDDPLLARVQRQHIAGIARIESMRARSEGYADFAGRHCAAFEYYAVVPLISNGGIGGTICLSLTAGTTSAAERQRRRVLQGLSVHASARLSQLQMKEGAAIRWDGVLAPDDVILCDLVTGGHTVEAMASALGVSANTVKKRLKRLYARLDVASRSELAMQFVLGPEAGPTKRVLGRFGAWTLASRE